MKNRTKMKTKINVQNRLLIIRSTTSPAKNMILSIQKNGQSTKHPRRPSTLKIHFLFFVCRNWIYNPSTETQKNGLIGSRSIEISSTRIRPSQRPKRWQY
jgi:hypothetical protein